MAGHEDRGLLLAPLSEERTCSHHTSGQALASEPHFGVLRNIGRTELEHVAHESVQHALDLWPRAKVPLVVGTELDLKG